MRNNKKISSLRLKIGGTYVLEALFMCIISITAIIRMFNIQKSINILKI